MSQGIFWKWLGLGALALVAIGCGESKTTEASPAPTGEKKVEGAKLTALKITMIAKSNDNPVFQSARVGAEAAAKELSTKEGIPITIDWRTPDKEDGTVQAQRIAQAVNEGTNAILLSCSDASKLTGAIDEAVGKGVPVMTFDSDAATSKRFAFYGVDDKACGAQIMSELATVLGGTGNVAILAGNQNAPNLQTRVAGVKEEAAKTPGIKIINTFYHNESPQDAAAAVKQAMVANPEINAWAMVGAWPLFTQTLLNDLDPAKVKIVAVDCLPMEMAYVEKGLAPVLLAQPTYQWGYVSVEKIVDKLVHNKEVPTINKMELVKVSKDNLNAWGKQLKEWGFQDVDPKYLTP